jgi:antitoxin MazE
MKKIQLLTGCALIFLSFSVFSQTSSLIDLHAAVKAGKIQVVNRELTLITEKSYSGISLSKELLDKYQITDKLELVLENDYILLRPVAEPRKNWEESFAEMHKNGDDRLLIDTVFEDENWD